MAVELALQNLVPARYHYEAGSEQNFDEPHRKFRRAKLLQTIYNIFKLESR
jgi:hypothetical protein